MSDYILIDGDKVLFDQPFANRVLMKPEHGVIAGSGHATIRGKRVCVEGDERRVEVRNVSYMIPGYNPGKGTLTIEKLLPNQVSRVTSSKGKKLLLKGASFIARLTPTQPAMSTSTPSTPEPIAPTTGMGRFVNGQLIAVSE
jgi:hypothetical protein